MQNSHWRFYTFNSVTSNLQLNKDNYGCFIRKKNHAHKFNTGRLTLIWWDLQIGNFTKFIFWWEESYICLCCHIFYFDLFYGPVNTFKVMSKQSVNLLTVFLGRLSPLSSWLVPACILSPVSDNCPSWISGRGRVLIEMISCSISMNEDIWPSWDLNLQSLDPQ